MVQIRPITHGDDTAFHELVQQNEDRLRDYFPITIEKAETPEKTSDAIRLYTSLAGKNELHVFVIEKESRIIGTAFLKNLDHQVKKCELAYFVDKEEEGKGFASNAVKMLIDFAFGDLGMNKVYCLIDPKNSPSNRVAVKNGFQLEGLLKQEFKLDCGHLVDLNYYGLFNNS